MRFRESKGLAKTHIKCQVWDSRSSLSPELVPPGTASRSPHLNPSAFAGVCTCIRLRMLSLRWHVSFECIPASTLISAVSLKAFEMPHSVGPMIKDWCHCWQKKLSLATAKPLIPDASWTKPGWKHPQRELRGAEKLRRPGLCLSYTHSHFINAAFAPLPWSPRESGLNSEWTRWNVKASNMKRGKEARKKNKLCRVLEKLKTWVYWMTWKDV